MSDLPEKIARLRELLAKAKLDLPVEALGHEGESILVAHGVLRWEEWSAPRMWHTLARTDSKVAADLIVAAVNALPALIEAADPETLRFGPWFEGERHAVAKDGCRYTIESLDPDDDSVTWRSRAWNDFDDRDPVTESEAIEAARSHDRARRGAR